jgi:prepilin peptidase CpaA
VDPILIANCTALLVAGVAAVTDVRRGVIPNWLTLPPLLLAPLAHGLLHGPLGAAGSVAAAAACGLVPYLLFRQGAAGGGDVKLFAALGAIAGVSLGLEAQLLTFAGAAALSLARLAWRGRLLATLANSTFLALNPLLPARHRRALAPEVMAVVRLGGFAFAGTLLAIGLRYPGPWT